MEVCADAVTWSVGWLGIRVGEATNPGPKGTPAAAPGTLYYGLIDGAYRIGCYKARTGPKGSYRWTIAIPADPSEPGAYQAPARAGDATLTCRDVERVSMSGLLRTPTEGRAYRMWAPPGYAIDHERWIPDLGVATAQAGMKRLSVSDAQAPKRRQRADASDAGAAGPAAPADRAVVPNLAWWDCVDYGEAMADRAYTSHELPPGLASAIVDVHTRVFEALAAAPQGSEDEERLCKVTLFLDRLLFCLRPGGNKVRRGGKATKTKGHGWERTVAYRLRLVNAGDWAALWREAERAEGRPPPSTAPADARRARRVEDYVQLGEVSRAVGAVCSTSAVCDTGADHTALLPLFPQLPAVAQFPLPADAPTALSHDSRASIAAAVRSTLRGFPRRSGTGPSDARFEHLAPLYHDERACAALGAVLTRFLAGEMPRPATDAFLAATVYARAKPDGGRRPIACGGTLRRVAAKAVCVALKDQFRRAVGPHQYAVARDGGMEKAHKTLQLLTEMRGDAVFLKLDFRNAYNSVHRPAVLAAVAERLPALLPIARTLLPERTTHYWYDGDGAARTIEARRGVDQGCPLSPVLFALAMAGPLDRLLAGLRAKDANARVLSYLDDVYIVVSASEASAALDTVRELFAPLGLELNSAKTQAWSPEAATPLPPGVAHATSLVCLGSNLRWSADDERGWFDLLEPNPGTGGEWSTAVRRLRHFTSRLDTLRAHGLSMHAALVLHRTYVNGAVTHFQRGNRAPTWFAEQWDAEVAAWYARELRRDLHEPARALLTLPLKLGGCGLASTAATYLPAYLGSWELCLAEVAADLGFTAAAQLQAAAPSSAQRLETAAASLRAAGVVDYRFEWELLLAEPQAKRQRELAQELHEVRQARLLPTVDAATYPGAEGDVRSSGGVGAGSFLEAPSEPRFRMADDALRTCLRARLLLPFPAHDPGRNSNPSTQCQHRNATGVLCGKALDAAGHHAEKCGEGAAMLNGHNNVCAELADYLGACGAPALREQSVPEWDRQLTDGSGTPLFEVRRNARGHPILSDEGLPIHDPVMDRAILDVSFHERATGRRAHADVTIGSAKTDTTEERRLRNQTDGRKAAVLADRKRARYDPTRNPHEGFVPFAIEARGRFGDDALALLRSMAPRDPSLRGRLIARGLQGLSVRVQTRLAELLLSAERANTPH